MNIRVQNNNTGSQLLNMPDWITVVVRDRDGNIVHCNHANTTEYAADVCRGDIVVDTVTVEECNTCGSSRTIFLDPTDNEWDSTEWSQI